jgi:hypothetical protein
VRAERGSEGWEPCGAAVSWPVIAPHLPSRRSLPAARPARTPAARFVAEYRGRQSPCYGAPRQMPQNNIEIDLLRTVTTFRTILRRSSTETLISMFGAWSQRRDFEREPQPAKHRSNLDGHLICQADDDRRHTPNLTETPIRPPRTPPSPDLSYFVHFSYDLAIFTAHGPPWAGAGNTGQADRSPPFSPRRSASPQRKNSRRTRERPFPNNQDHSTGT